MSAPSMEVPQADPGAFVRRHREEIDEAIDRVLASGQFILGPEVSAFENEFSQKLGVRHSVAVANGTEALWLALRAVGVKSGDEIIVPSLTATATAAAVVELGARPVFADVRSSDLCLDPEEVGRRITPETRAIVPVHLYGNPASLVEFAALAEHHGLALVEDCAQAHGASYGRRPVGTVGRLGTFSFYPTKNLGALGDGGLVACSEETLARELQLLRQYGWQDRYSSAVHGWNSRLDELQAAILRVALKYLDAGNQRRRELAALYDSLLPASVRGPAPDPEGTGAYHLYVIRHPRRNELREFLRARGIGSAVHYPVPIHLQLAYQVFGSGEGSLPITEAACREVLSLPLYPELDKAQIRHVAEAVGEFVAGEKQSKRKE